MLELTGFLGLTRIPLGFWAHTDLTDPTVSLCGWEISQMILRVWTCVGSDGGTLLSLSRTYLLDPSDKSDLSDGLDIFKNNPWDLCEASVGLGSV